MPALSLWQRYRLRLKRRRLLWRSFRSRHQLTMVEDRTQSIGPNGVLAFCVLRNEATRLPYFLDYYRSLGVGHFLIVDNSSDDGSLDLLRQAPDVSLWQTPSSYRASRFGLDWLTWLQIRYGHNRWSLLVDIDELLVYDGSDQQSLSQLTDLLDRRGQRAFGALMLDLYPKGPVSDQSYRPGQAPQDVLNWFDPRPYRAVRQSLMGNLWVQGGARERMFFQNAPERSPTLNKIPLIKWNRRFAYVNSTHSVLPAHLNAAYSGPTGMPPAGVLLHTKFLPEIVSKSEIEKQRGEHFNDPSFFDGYYDSVIQNPDFWTEESVQLTGNSSLIQAGLMPMIDWQK